MNYSKELMKIASELSREEESMLDRLESDIDSAFYEFRKELHRFYDEESYKNLERVVDDAVSELISTISSKMEKSKQK